MGVNLFGMRHRQDVWESWLRTGKDMRYVLEHLGAANFDPEFSIQFEKEAVLAYNEQNPGQELTLRSRRGIRARLRELVAAG